MSIPISYVGVDGDRCSCGRRASLRHCPSCGSFMVKFRPSARISRQTEEGSWQFIERYTCTRCGFVFEDSLRKSCEAPVYMTKQQRLVVTAVQVKSAQGLPLNLQERQVLRAFDTLTNRFRAEIPVDAAFAASLKNNEVTKLSEDTMRRLSSEYATHCIKTGEKASPEGREQFVRKRLEEASACS
jgi:hypothetical protein